MKKVLFLSMMLASTFSFAQMKLKVNDKNVADGAVIKAQDIKKMEVAFDKYKGMDYYYGKVFIFINFNDASGKTREEYALVKEGSTTIKAFLSEPNTYYALPVGGGNSPFKSFYQGSGESVESTLKHIGKKYDSKEVKISMALGFREKIGYEKYGDLIYLIKPQEFTIDNTLYYEEGLVSKEQDKIKAEEAKKVNEERKVAQEAQRAEAAKKAKNQERVEQGKGLIKRGLRGL